jgi:hypothetical protein
MLLSLSRLIIKVSYAGLSKMSIVGLVPLKERTSSHKDRLCLKEVLHTV